MFLQVYIYYIATATLAPFASLKKQAETLFRLICCKRKTLFRLKKQAEKYRRVEPANLKAALPFSLRSRTIAQGTAANT